MTTTSFASTTHRRSAAPKRDRGCKTLSAPLMCWSITGHTGPSPLDVLIRRGDSLLTKRDITGAISAYSQALLLDSQSVEALMGRTDAFIAANSHSAALRDITHAISLERSNARALGTRAILYWRMVTASPVKRDDLLSLALADATEAIRLDPMCQAALDARSALFGALDSEDIYRLRQRSASGPANGRAVKL